MTPKRKNALNGKSPVMTYLVVLAAYAVLELCIKTGIMSSHLQGLLVPMVYYAIVAVGLNICVGILGELSLGHAGFMCIGAFGSAVFSLLTDGVLPDGLRFLLAFLIGVWPSARSSKTCSMPFTLASMRTVCTPLCRIRWRLACRRTERC